MEGAGTRISEGIQYEWRELLAGFVLVSVRKQDPLYFPLDGTWSENILVVDGYGLCQFVWVFVTADWVMFLALEQMWQMYVAYV